MVWEDWTTFDLYQVESTEVTCQAYFINSAQKTPTYELAKYQSTLH